MKTTSSIFLIILLNVITGCAGFELGTPMKNYAWQAHQGKNVSELLSDRWECEKDSQRFGGRNSQARAFYQCMDVKGWTLTVVKNEE